MLNRKKTVCTLILFLLAFNGIMGCGQKKDDSVETTGKQASQNVTTTGTEDAGETVKPEVQTEEAKPEDFDLAVEDVPELLPDILGIRELQYEEMPLLETREEIPAVCIPCCKEGRFSS